METVVSLNISAYRPIVRCFLLDLIDSGILGFRWRLCSTSLGLNDAIALNVIGASKKTHEGLVSVLTSSVTNSSARPSRLQTQHRKPRNLNNLSADFKIRTLITRPATPWHSDTEVRRLLSARKLCNVSFHAKLKKRRYRSILVLKP